MDLLTVITIINFVFLLMLFYSRGSSRMTYTESIVARQLSAYALTILIFIVIVLMFFQKFSAVKLAGLMINLLLLSIILGYLFTRLMKRFHAGR